MPKQPDLIAGEMQGDATISKEIEAAAAKLYARRNEPAVQQALKAAVAAETELPPAQLTLAAHRPRGSWRRPLSGLIRSLVR
jgi:hypothetical protein